MKIFRGVAIFLVGQSASLHVPAQALQDRFVIASFHDPVLTMNQAIDDQTLIRMRDAYFNVLGAGEPDRVSEYEHYKLQRVSMIPRLPGVPPIRLLISDSWLYNSPYRDAYRDAILGWWLPDPLTESPFQPFTAEMRAAVYGFNLRDEPLHTDLVLRDRINQWATQLHAAEPSRVSYWNLGPIIIDITPPTANPPAWLVSAFRTYIRGFATGNTNPFIVFDYYPFLNMGTRGSYFLAFQVMAEEARDARKAFWATIMGINHRQTTGTPPNCTVVPQNDYAPLDEPSIRMQAYVAVVYGAKGITWFATGSPASASSCGWMYEPGMMEAGSPIYPWVQSVNRALTNMGPTLIRARWLGTVHGSSSDPFSDQQNLPIPDASTPVLTGSVPSAFAVGIFSNPGNIMRNSLAILNKDRTNANVITVTLRKADVVYRHAKQSNRWIKHSGRTKTFTLTVQPGDMELIGLGPRDLVSSTIRRKK